ncbi:hypothetical protein [Pedobacter zeae]|uniref:Uncharacterized protein n=1 Tax=Pedobacter zeae TaxID=1737356 RepID=A0A7W6P489_9SPHI|nr:hypothetical protein [Pedobacter zeae]MBB4107284.1 hypothetical protein [Pedobacter zeae]GGH06870.1 hypothetical protein GCM10007422_23780 [Pedobacter zeae]
MKKIITLCFLLGFVYAAKAQKEDQIYAFKYADIEMKRWDGGTKTEKRIAGQIDHSTKLLKFQLRYKEGNNWIYKILPSKSDVTDPSVDSTKSIPVKVHYVDKADNNDFFYITENDLSKYAVTGFTEPRIVGLDGLVIPMKIRFSNHQGGNFDVTQAVTIGFAYNYRLDKWGMLDNKSADLVLGLNATSVGVDEKTVPGVYTTKAQAVAISPVFGFKVRYEGIEFGLLGGMDILTGEARRAWVYRKSPWLGITIGTLLKGIIPGKVQQ